ncbi:MAG TPA: hypothetical protein VGQ68_06735 [Gaiellaceae bacterium]|nr:hypothetical protein [Gaiellaceae bacterium]
MGRRRLFALVLAAGSLLGVGLYAKRGRKREQVDLYFTDGSMVSVAGDSPEGARLLTLARDALRAAK